MRAPHGDPRRPCRHGTRRRPFWADRRGVSVGLVGAVLVLLLLPSSPFAAGHVPAPTIRPDLRASFASASVTIASGALGNLSSSFWGADVRVYYPLGTTQSNALNATPISYLRWPGGATVDSYNFTANRIYNANGSYYTPPSNESQFVSWCRSVKAGAIVQLPAEINDPATARYYVAYTIQTLKFHPAYWEIGNEPALWTHFGTPWSKWTASQNVNATPSTYAAVVHSYVAAIRSVDPVGRILGLAGVGTGGYGEDGWIRASVALNGRNISAVAIHVYPAGGTNAAGNVTLSKFYDTLEGKSSLEYRVPKDRAAITSACPTCSRIQLFVTELGTGTQGGPYATYMSSFASVPFLAAEVAEAMTANLPNVDLFALQSNYSGSLLNTSGSPSITYALYSQMLVHLQTTVLNATLTPAPVHFFLVPTRSLNGSTYALLAVNANASVGVRLDLTGSGFPLVGVSTSYTWNYTSASPIVAHFPHLVPSLWVLPPRSVLVLQVG